jgi:hypothetical protein
VVEGRWVIFPPLIQVSWVGDPGTIVLDVEDGNQRIEELGKQHLHLVTLNLEQNQRTCSCLRCLINILALLLFIFCSILLFLLQKICTDYKVVTSYRAKLDTAWR